MKRHSKTSKSNQKLVFTKEVIRELKCTEIELGACVGGIAPGTLTVVNC